MNSADFLDLAKSHYKRSEFKVISQAVKFAEDKHASQKRASGDPFVTHPLEVASILIDWQLDTDSIVAGILHDVVEDTNGTLTEIGEMFGEDVEFLVDGVTKVGQARSGMRELSSYSAKTADNLSKLLVATSQDIRVLLIKLADRLHNLRTLEYLPKSKQNKIAEESLGVFAPLADRLGMGRVKIEIEELAFQYVNPKEYRQLHAELKKRVGRATKYLEQVRREVATELAKHKFKFKIDGRIKSTYSLYKKLKKDPIEEIYDLMALRIIVETKAQCYHVLGILHAMYQPMLTKIKDYISVPKPNGYQSLHTTVITPHEQIVEFQIRTQAMHEYAERGLAASFHYNEQKLTKNYARGNVSALPRNLQWITELQEMTYRMQSGEQTEKGLPIDLFSDRIFVYSPKGDIYDLPVGATVLDFAFAVHSDIGRHAHSARVNNKIAKLSSELINGDIVEITTRSNVEPNQDWVKHVKTARARQRIRSIVKQSP